MRLDIRKIKTIVISPDHNEKYHTRKEKTFHLLQRHNFANIEHFKSGTEKYPLCLTLANIEILKQNLNDEPILIVEDDIEVFQDIPESIEIQDTVDAFYLGLSIHGGHPRLNTNVCLGADVAPINHGLFKVYNMLGAHAIIYISQKYKLAVLNCLEKSLESNYVFNDILISRIQKFFCVLCPSKPVFIQNDECDLENSKATQIIFS